MKWNICETYSKIINCTDNVQMNQENIEFFFNGNLLLKDRFTCNQKLGIFYYFLNLIRSGVLQSGPKSIKVANYKIIFSRSKRIAFILDETKIFTDDMKRVVGYLTLYEEK